MRADDSNMFKPLYHNHMRTLFLHIGRQWCKACVNFETREHRFRPAIPQRYATVVEVVVARREAFRALTASREGQLRVEERCRVKHLLPSVMKGKNVRQKDEVGAASVICNLLHKRRNGKISDSFHHSKILFTAFTAATEYTCCFYNPSQAIPALTFTFSAWFGVGRTAPSPQAKASAAALARPHASSRHPRTTSPA